MDKTDIKDLCLQTTTQNSVSPITNKISQTNCGHNFPIDLLESNQEQNSCRLSTEQIIQDINIFNCQNVYHQQRRNSLKLKRAHTTCDINCQCSFSQTEIKNLCQDKTDLVNKIVSLDNTSLISTEQQDKVMSLEETKQQVNQVNQQGGVLNTIIFEKNKKRNSKSKQKQKLQQNILDKQIQFSQITFEEIQIKSGIQKKSLLNQKKEKNEEQIYTLGKHQKYEKIRVYFFNNKAIYLDFNINKESTTVSSFKYFILESYLSNSKMDPLLIKHQENSDEYYEIRPSMGDDEELYYKADQDVPEICNEILLVNTDIDKVCCFVEKTCEYPSDLFIDKKMDSHLQNTNNYKNTTFTDLEGVSNLQVFEEVYQRTKQLVFQIVYKEKDFQSIIRIDQNKNVSDLFDIIRKKININKNQFVLLGKIYDCESSITLDLEFPVSQIRSKQLTLQKKQYFDQTSISNGDNSSQKYNQFKTFQKSQIIEDDDDQNEEISRASNTEEQTKEKIELKLTENDMANLHLYEEFDVIKISNKSKKEQKRIIGIDENNIYNKKNNNAQLNIKSIICYPFINKNITKCQEKHIDDIIDLKIISQNTVFIEFREKKQSKIWLLKNNTPYLAYKMYKKLMYLRKNHEC